MVTPPPTFRLCRPLRHLSTKSPRTPATFTRQHLDDVRAKLAPVPTWPPDDPPPHTVLSDRVPREAAVLIPLLNVDNVAHILFEIRSSKLRVHGGEVSFPGGKCDPTDKTSVETALRESQEELGISPSSVEILGMVDGPEYALGNKSRVWPFVGYLHPSDVHPRPSHNTTALPALPLDSLRPSLQEVSALLPFPLHTLLDRNRQSLHFFRMDPNRPYLKYRINDLVQPPLEAGGKHLEIWGLSGWFLNKLAWRLGWMDPPEMSSEED